MSVGARAAGFWVRVYQAAFAYRASPCRLAPSCSVYARLALHEHGFARGLWLTVRRLARCHPWTPLGCDPVPAAAARTARPMSGARRADPGRLGDA